MAPTKTININRLHIDVVNNVVSPATKIVGSRIIIDDSEEVFNKLFTRDGNLPPALVAALQTFVDNIRSS